MFVYQPPPPGKSPVIYVDDTLIVADKPAGLLSVPGRGEDRADCLITRVQQDYADALTVHRLDLATSGLLVFARGAEMHRRLSKLFHDRAVDKRYIAVVAGQMATESGQVNLPLIVDWPNRPRQIVDHTIGRPSLTHYWVRERDPVANTTRVELEPWTGRTHQLRVHMASLGHPILGDDLYGDVTSAPRLLLHAMTLAFTHPMTGEPMAFRAEPDF